MRQMKMLQDWGYNYIYLRHMGNTTRVNLEDHNYRDVNKTPVEDFDSATAMEDSVPSWLKSKAPLWVCGASECGSHENDESMENRSFKDSDYILVPFPEERMEPLVWTQILATLDICVNELTPTRFCDDEGYDLIPFNMIQGVLVTVDESHDKNETKWEKSETQCVRIHDKIFIVDMELKTNKSEKELSKNDSKDNSFHDAIEMLQNLELDADDKYSEDEGDDNLHKEKFFDFPNQKPRRLKKYHLPLSQELLERVHATKERKRAADQNIQKAQEEAKERAAKQKQMLEGYKKNKITRLCQITTIDKDEDCLDPYILTELGDKPLTLHALVGSGAHLNTISWDVYQRLPEVKVQPKERIFLGFNGTESKSPGFVTLMVYVKGSPCSHNFFVLPSESPANQIILGTPCQRKYKAYIHWAENQVFVTAENRDLKLGSGFKTVHIFGLWFNSDFYNFGSVQLSSSGCVSGSGSNFVTSSGSDF
ncbi:hypothetical protein L7F22_035422 [Adiantum nelumboides]|nr:hypothetical protein [Adiantum nelumboides]